MLIYQKKDFHMLKQTSNTPLFDGQTTHQLTDTELKRLISVFDIDKAYQSRLNAILTRITATPTGAEQARQILAYANGRKGKMDIDIKDDNYFSSWNKGRSLGNTIILPKSFFTNEKPETTGTTILHEALHCRQKNDPNDHIVLVDAETQALSFQLMTETGTQRDNYTKSMESNYQKWLNIARNPNTKTPKGCLKFKPLPNVNIEKARQAYAHQMAAYETRAQFMKDFLRHPDKWDKHALKYPSYTAYELQQKYLNETNYYYRQTDIEDADFIRDILSRNPLLKAEDLTKDKIIQENKPFQRLNKVPFGDDIDDSTKEFVFINNTGVALFRGNPIDNNAKDKIFKVLENEETFRRTLSNNKQDEILTTLATGNIKNKLSANKRLTQKEIMIVKYALINNSPDLTREEYLSQMIGLVNSSVWNKIGFNGRLHRQLKTELSQTIGTQTVLAQNGTPIHNNDLADTLRAAQQHNTQLTDFIVCQSVNTRNNLC